MQGPYNDAAAVIAGQHDFDAPAEVVFGVLTDPDRLRVEWRARDSAGPQGVAWVCDAPAGGCVVHAEVAVPGGDAQRQRAESLLAEAMWHLQRDVSDNFNAG
jgi:hypothetical protein